MCNQIEGAEFEMIPFPQDRKAIDVGDFICDYSAFSNSFGWQPKITFEKGISKTLDFFKKELSTIYNRSQMILLAIHRLLVRHIKMKSMRLYKECLTRAGSC